jgi:hypothetical protein
MSMAERAQTTCDQCGQTDDHPKVHGTAGVPQFNADGSPVMVVNAFGNTVQLVIPTSKHHDCLSHSEEAFVRGSAQEKDSGPKASAIIDACKDGARGDELLALIEGGELPQAEGLYAQEVRDNG